VTGRY